jgi:hypothetical protein
MAAPLNPPFPQEPGPVVPQSADPGQLLLGTPAPTRAQNNGLGGPIIEFRVTDIFRFPADAIIVPTDQTYNAIAMVHSLINGIDTPGKI